MRRINLDGTNAEDLVTGLNIPAQLALDPVGGWIWWTESSQGTIHRARLDGSDVTEVVAGLTQPRKIAFLPPVGMEEGKIYFVANPGSVPVPATSQEGTVAVVLALLAASSTVLLWRLGIHRSTK